MGCGLYIDLCDLDKRASDNQSMRGIWYVHVSYCTPDEARGVVLHNEGYKSYYMRENDPHGLWIMKCSVPEFNA